MSKQCLSIEQMQHLKELGVDTSKANVYWHNVVKFEKKKTVNEWILSLSSSVPLMIKTIPTFTLQDILDLLPEEIYTEENELATLKVYFPNDGYWEFSYMGLHKCMEFFLEENVIDAAYDMLCWVVENGYLKEK